MGASAVRHHIARKRFGQHFLKAPDVIDRIVRAIDPRAGERLVEIGPGLGAMTGPLRHRCEALTVIELDRDLAVRLRQRGDLDVVEADVLKVDFAALAQRLGGPLRVVGNLPYNISSPILFHLMDSATVVVDQVFMLQKEVVERMAARPGGRDYGRLSVMLQWRYAIESLFDVPPEAFDPPPKVDSAIVAMRPHAAPAAVAQALLGEMVTVAFSQRRKLLRHTLGRWLEARGLAGAFDVQRRAEEVPVAEYIALAQRVARQ
ncbi:MAG TPA: 16S rRNA (adenine(1518)-N(6)/adenine(1519)-N(6))-dimethyltransferase RsmA [Burkholderiaceae bacterium]|jgi:16S rRNA (adenine1518-N6/adenine1519-N6)-dimethyltransferase|nr:16S rRNA (adenine(1518)-N(6)/adenine(1519)-N(6))-dimethyltransferase RsmA [Burkholderiaceae bacterium]